MLPVNSSGRRLARVVLVLGAASMLALAARADDEEPWYKKIELHAFVSSVYTYNLNRPVSGTNQLRVFDYEHDNFDIDGELVVLMPVSERKDVGFRIDIAAGSTIPHLTAARGLFRDAETGKAQDVDLQQAFVSYVAPVGGGLRFDFGKCVTHTGAEVIEGYDGYGDSHTHSFMFGYAIPFTQTGLRISYPWCDKLSTQLHVVNGWDNVKDNNDGKTFGLQIAITPTAKVSLYVNGLYGAEQDKNTSNKRTLGDIVGVFRLGDKFTLTGNVDVAREDGAGPDGSDGKWSGAALSGRWDCTGAFSLALRAERFDDHDGARTGTAQKLAELTLTPQVKLSKHFVLRGDARFDSSDHDVFEKDRAGSLSGHQTTLSLNALFAY